MQDTASTIFFFGFIGLITYLIAANVDVRLKLSARVKCLFGKHNHGTPSQYRCKICKSAKKHPHLRVINGGKKSIDIKFPF